MDSQRIVYTGGTFDLFHDGHVNFLKQCKRIAGNNGKVVVSLNTNDFIKEFKGSFPVYSYEQRERLLMGCRYVDMVCPNTGGADSTQTILEVFGQFRAFQPLIKFVVIGTDWAVKDYYSQMGFTQDWLDKEDIGLIYVPYTPGISTTQMKARILEA